MEKRDHPRMDIRLRCQISVVGKQAPSLEGVTENISRRGMLVHWAIPDEGPEPPAVGDSLIVDVNLPANPQFGARSLHCAARVVRVMPSAEGCLTLALALEQVQFRRAGLETVNQTVKSAAMEAALWRM